MNNSRLKTFFIFFGSLTALTLVYGIGLNISRHGKSVVTISVAPSVADITLDNKSVRVGRIYVSPGKHSLTSSLGGFKTDNSSFTTKERTPETISLALKPADQAGQNFLDANPVYQQQREAVGGQEKAGLAAKYATPIIQLLPISDLKGPYKIDYGDSQTRPGGTVILISDSSPHGRANALKWIRQQGYDPTELEIIYTDFVSPLAVSSRGGR